MKQTILFSKMHGAGNDYIYVNTLLYNIDDPSKLARLWSDRHKGIGSDGLVLIGRSPIPEADFSQGAQSPFFSYSSLGVSSPTLCHWTRS